jgi:hypothetical protein
MSVENPTGGAPTPGPSAGDGAPANAPSMTIEELSAKVAEALLPRLSTEITGATKRHAASLREEFLGLLKGNADAPKTGDKDKADPRDVELTKLRETVAKLAKESEVSFQDARAGIIAKALADYEAVQGKKITNPGREFGELALRDHVQRMEDRSWIVKRGEDTRTLADFISAFYKDRPELLASSARAGTGATGSKGAQPPASDMPKSKAEVRWTITKDAITGATKRTPRGLAYVNAFKSQFPEVWASLPDGDL